MLSIGHSFTDVVSHKRVYDFIDCYGRMWHANTRWSFFRNRIGLDWQEEVQRRAEEQQLLNTEGRSGGNSFYDLGRE